MRERAAARLAAADEALAVWADEAARSGFGPRPVARALGLPVHAAAKITPARPVLTVPPTSAVAAPVHARSARPPVASTTPSEAATPAPTRGEDLAPAQAPAASEAPDDQLSLWG